MRCVRVTRALRSLNLEVFFAKMLVSLTQGYRVENQDFLQDV